MDLLKDCRGVPRCINIDWLEVYCLEDAALYPVDAEYYRKQGYYVHEREYGTRQYKEMFTILDEHDEPLIEIRRHPVSADEDSRNKGMFNPYSCHIRLSNRSCYHPEAIVNLENFLFKHRYSVQRIFRLDICMDFIRFDGGDNPSDFVNRYMAGRYSKINQCNITAHGVDQWAGRSFNSISWGNPKSMVSTKIYCKSLELKQAKDKPYIRYSWQNAGLVDDYVHLSKKKADGSVFYPDIWRVEFSIKSSAVGWYVTENCHGRKQKRILLPHNLTTYDSPSKLLQAFAHLAHHYFFFRKFKDGVRKDRCEEKMLFNFGIKDYVVQLDRLLTERPANKAVDALRKRLYLYRVTHSSEDIRKACDTLISDLDRQSVIDSLSDKGNQTELTILQQLLGLRVNEENKRSLSEDKQLIEAMLLPDTPIF